MDVGADVQLEEVARGGNSGQAGRVYVLHAEGDEADPGLAVVRVDLEVRGHERAQRRRLHGPVEEEQLRPGLPHRRPAGGFRADGEAVDHGGGVRFRLRV
jgi:hypothetical protein